MRFVADLWPFIAVAILLAIVLLGCAPGRVQVGVPEIRCQSVPVTFCSPEATGDGEG